MPYDKSNLTFVLNYVLLALLNTSVKNKMLRSRHTALKQRCINVDATSQCRIDVDTTLFQRHVPASIEKLTYYHFVQLVKIAIIMNIHMRFSV